MNVLAIAGAFLRYADGTTDDRALALTARDYDTTPDIVRACVEGRFAGREFAYRDRTGRGPSYEYLAGVFPFVRPVYCAMRDLAAARKAFKVRA